MLKLTLLIVVSFFLPILLMISLYPHTAKFFNLNGPFVNIISMTQNLEVPHHDNEDSLSRKTQISGLVEPMLDFARDSKASESRLCLVTGLGFGNAEYGTRDIFLSDFYNRYKRLWYYDFILSFIFIETGIIGLIIYGVMWLYLALRGFIGYVREKDSTALYKLLMAVSFMLISLYDITLRNNYGYIMWVALAIPFVLKKKEQSAAEHELSDESVSAKVV